MKDGLLAPDFDPDVARGLSTGSLQCNWNQSRWRAARRLNARLDIRVCSYAGQLLISIRLDPAEKKLALS
ncbi:hypothetical protein [Collimonas pratensis]|uniref:Uncharacterized protein n=1 Tax=Collimonas pratensis TaxID=279113 RepID=A0A127QBQ0_9BURK|nr:hypothetical protein [Collimonas pratensis]AMP07052.1 hypothetical protein CPter91_4757 [Collimonas pratensis]